MRISSISLMRANNNSAKFSYNTGFSHNNLKTLTRDTISFGTKEKNQGMTGWLVIPSQQNDSEHFEENLAKMEPLARSGMYDPGLFLENNDFHVYLENGEPKLEIGYGHGFITAIHSSGIRGSFVPVKYLDIAKEYIKGYKHVDYRVREELENAEKSKELFDKIQDEFGESGFDYRPDSIKRLFDIIGVRCKVDRDNLIVLDEYKQPDANFTFRDIGIDENGILKHVKKITNDLNLKNSELTDLGALQKIGRNGDFRHSKVKSLGNLKIIGWNAYFDKSQVEDFGNLEEIGSDAIFGMSPVKSLKHLKTIGGGALFSNSNIEDLGELEKIGGDANFSRSKVKSLGNLKSIGGRADFVDSSVEHFGDLEYIGNGLRIKGKTPLRTLGKLKHIEGNFDLECKNLKSLGDLESIGGVALFKLSGLRSFENLRSIKGRLIIEDPNVISIGRLEKVGGSEAFPGDVYLRDTGLVKEDFENVNVSGEFKYE